MASSRDGRVGGCHRTGLSTPEGGVVSSTVDSRSRSSPSNLGRRERLVRPTISEYFPFTHSGNVGRRRIGHCGGRNGGADVGSVSKGAVRPVRRHSGPRAMLSITRMRATADSIRWLGDGGSETATGCTFLARLPHGKVQNAGVRHRVQSSRAPKPEAARAPQGAWATARPRQSIAEFGVPCA